MIYKTFDNSIEVAELSFNIFKHYYRNTWFKKSPLFAATFFLNFDDNLNKLHANSIKACIIVQNLK